MIFGWDNTRCFGKVHFKIDPKQWRSEDSLNETTPDFYMVVMCEGQAIFKTPVAIDVRMEADAHFNAAEGEWIDPAPFWSDYTSSSAGYIVPADRALSDR